MQPKTQTNHTVTVIEDGAAIELHTLNSASARFHGVWLRDNALDSDTRSPDNGQRLIGAGDIPRDIRITEAAIEYDRESSGASLAIRFNGADKRYLFPVVWLEQHRYDCTTAQAKVWLPEHIDLFDENLDSAIAAERFDNVQRDSTTLARWLGLVRQLGFARLGNCPMENGALTKIVELFGYIRETQYGRWFEVRTEVNPTNLAYTGLGLQAHTDNPYRDPVPTLQILFCLENSADGGETVLVDGFNIARVLNDQQPEYFELLAHYLARFEYAGSEGVYLAARKPIIELTADGEITAIRFNNRSQAPITDVPYVKMPDYYEALRAFSDLLDSPEYQVRLKLVPGECLVFDNTRVLHGRTAYSGSGSRWLQGCYADRDGLYSRFATLTAKH